MKNKAQIMCAAFNHLVHEGDKILKLPVAGNGLSAKVCEKTGARAINLTSFAVNSAYGQPNMEFADFYTLFNQAKEVIDSVDIPVLCDVGTGHGFRENIARTTRSYEAIGAAGIYIDDGVWPKACGVMAKTLIAPIPEMVNRIYAAVAARKRNNFTIMAHTSSRDICDIDETINKCSNYVKAGADMLFIDNIASIMEVSKIIREIPDTPLLINVCSLKEPISMNELFKLGVSIVTFDDNALYAGVEKVQKTLKQELKCVTAPKKQKTYNDAARFSRLVGTESIADIEKKFKI